MAIFERLNENPIIRPDKEHDWEAMASFNPSVVQNNEVYHLLYRAQSLPADHSGTTMSISSIGYAKSTDGIHFNERRQVIKPEEDWEKFGCEDPRVTFCENKYYIFYTALSKFPFAADGIRVGLAITKDFLEFEKHPVTPFNSKAMALFPEKINGKFAAVLTVHTDLPPAKIALAFFDSEQDMWSERYWKDWYARLDEHVVPLLRSAEDHLEIGAQPVKVDEGWLLIYSYIQHYFSQKKLFGIEAVLLDARDPSKILGKTAGPLLFPEKKYELDGDVPNITFPSGALLQNDQLLLYYGAADTRCCVARADLDSVLSNLALKRKGTFRTSAAIGQSFKRYSGNPIISPRPELSWEAMATFNPAVIYEGGRFHIIYRAMSFDGTSVMGYASSPDGVHIDERLSFPVYVPRAGFEQKLKPGNSGCEDPRMTVMGDEIYMFYTAFDGYTPRVAFTTIRLEDFLNKHWNWAEPKVITPPNVPDKDSCILKKKVNGKFVIFHRALDSICINMIDDCFFGKEKWLVHRRSLIKPRKTYWDNSKFGIAAPPIETAHGWLMFYHRVTLPGGIYKVEAALLDLNDPATIIAQADATLLEPEIDYEGIGIVPNVVFPCGAVLLNGSIYLYYGGADKYVAVAKMELAELLKRFGICP